MKDVKFCKDCANYVHLDPTDPATGHVDSCRAAIDFVRGERFVGSCWNQRSMPLSVAPWHCGREGQFFEPVVRPPEARRLEFELEATGARATGKSTALDNVIIPALVKAGYDIYWRQGEPDTHKLLVVAPLSMQKWGGQ